LLLMNDPGSVWGLVLGIVVFIVILGAFYFLSKRIAKGSVFAGKHMKVIERVMLGKETSILLLQVGLRLVVIGTGRDGMTLLFEMNAGDFMAAQKKEGEPQGLFGRFTKSVRSGLTGASEAESASFADLLRRMEERNPVAAPEQEAGDAGSPHIWEKHPPRHAKYQSEIENLLRLSQPEAFDRRDRPADFSAPRYETPPRPEAHRLGAEGRSDKERAERIDQLLDLVSQRQARLDDRNHTGDKG
jgi:flagellar biogenesis protein FliO